MVNTEKVKELAGFIWNVADLLRGDYKQSDYGKVILPLTVLRRLDCVLAETKQKVLDFLPKVETMNLKNIDPVLNKVSGFNFYNKSKFDFNKLIADPNNLAQNLSNYINGFSQGARDILEYFSFNEHIQKLEEANILFQVIEKFKDIDLKPPKIVNGEKNAGVSSIEMGYVFEELIRKFSELSNETAGEHFTPREVIKLMVNLLFINDDSILRKEGVVKTLYDPACGTGGMLSIGEDHLRDLNSEAILKVFGQEINPESYAICKSDMLIKGQSIDNIKFGNTFTMDGLEDEKFDYMLSNPPFGVDWKKVEKQIKTEYEKKGFNGRFGAGLPRINDGSFLFLQHMISKMKTDDNGSRIGIVFNGSPLFTGSAGSGESEIRKWIIENDWLEAIIGLPNQLFYNTGISTYIWILTNRKSEERKGKIQLINTVDFFVKMQRSLGNKRNEISEEQIKDITRIYGEFKNAEYSKIFDNNYFGYSRITVERPSKDENGTIETDKKGNIKPDSELRDYENVPLSEDIKEYFEREVKPYAPDAWIDESKTKIGYEINFTKEFYKYKPLRSLAEIKADILALEKETEGLLMEVIS